MTSKEIQVEMDSVANSAKHLMDGGRIESAKSHLHELPLWEIALQLAIQNEKPVRCILCDKVAEVICEECRTDKAPAKEELWPKIEKSGRRWALWMSPLSEPRMFDTEELAKEHVRKIAQMMNDYVPPKQTESRAGCSIAEFDDGSHVELASWTGGANEVGAWGELELLFAYPDGIETRRRYRALDLQHDKSDKTEASKSGPAGERGGDSPAEQCARDFAQVINKWSLESESNTPDFILANYLKFCLAAFATASNQREQWHGRKNAPGSRVTEPSSDASAAVPIKELTIQQWVDLGTKVCSLLGVTPRFAEKDDYLELLESARRLVEYAGSGPGSEFGGPAWDRFYKAVGAMRGR